MSEKLKELTKEEIKRMLVIATEEDSYIAKCFAMLLLECKEAVLNEKQCEMLEEFIYLLSHSRKEEALKLINEKYQ